MGRGTGLETRRAACVLAVLATLVAACNAISGLDADYKLGGDGTLPDDAGSETSSDSSGSGGFDGGPDAPDAASPDAGDAGTWCPSGAIFCENWDDTTTTWTRAETVGGAWSIAAGEGIAGSNALLAHANSTTSSRKIVRWKSIAGTFPDGTRYTLTFRFRLANFGVNYAVIGAIQANNTQQTNTEYGLAAYKNCPGAATVCLDESNPAEEGSPHPFIGQVGYQPTAWHRAEISVVRNGNDYVGTVKVDDHPPLDADGATYFGTPRAPSVIEVGVGLFFTGNEPGTGDFYIDDIAVVASP